jgi:ketosteroid isomerase-like protein
MVRDIAGMESVAAEDFIQWQSIYRREYSKAELFGMLGEVLQVANIVYRSIELWPLSDDCVLQRCVTDISIEGVGAKIGVPYAMVYRTRGQQITRCDEYMDGRSLPEVDFG